MQIKSNGVRWALRSALIVAYILLAMIMFMIGRTHTVLIDNKDTTDGKYTELTNVECTIGNNEPEEYYGGERDKIKLRGQHLRITLTFFSGETVTRDIHIPLFDDAVIVSLPMIAAESEESPVKLFNLYGDN